MNIKFAIKQVASLAAVVLSSDRLSKAVQVNAVDLDEAFRLQARFEGVVGNKSVSFGTVSVNKTFRKFFSDKDTGVLAALWMVVVSVDRAGEVLSDLRPATVSTPHAPRLTAEEIASLFDASIVD